MSKRAETFPLAVQFLYISPNKFAVLPSLASVNPKQLVVALSDEQ